MLANHHIHLGDGTRLFEVTIVDGPLQIVRGHEVVTDPIRESLPPHHGWALLGKVHAAHAEAAGVMGTHESWMVGNDLAELSGTRGEVLD